MTRNAPESVTNLAQVRPGGPLLDHVIHTPQGDGGIVILSALVVLRSQTGSVRPQTTASTVAPFWVVTVCTQPLGR
jgi:hypothetical protein